MSDERAVGAAPFAWTIPGDDQADCNGFIPTKVVREGEFTKPLYAAPPKPAPDAVQERDKERPIIVHCIGLLIEKFGAEPLVAAWAIFDYLGQPKSLALAPPVPSPDGAGEPVAWGRPHVEYSASRGQSRVEYWVSREDGKRIETGLATPPVRADREAIARPMMRAKIIELTNDLLSPDYIPEEVERFADAILSLDVQPGAGERNNIIRECVEKISDLRISEAGLFDPQHSGQRGQDRSDALYDACQVLIALSRQPPQSSSEGEQRAPQGNADV